MNQLFGLQHVGKWCLPKLKDLQFTATEEERNQETFTFKEAGVRKFGERDQWIIQVVFN